MAEEREEEEAMDFPFFFSLPPSPLPSPAAVVVFVVVVVIAAAVPKREINDTVEEAASQVAYTAYLSSKSNGVGEFDINQNEGQNVAAVEALLAALLDVVSSWPVVLVSLSTREPKK